MPPSGVTGLRKELSVRLAWYHVGDAAVSRGICYRAITAAALRCASMRNRELSRYYMQCDLDTEMSTTGRTSGSGRNSSARWPTKPGGRSSPVRRSKKALRHCEALLRSRCVTVRCFWPAMPPTSFLRPAPRASISRLSDVHLFVPRARPRLSAPSRKPISTLFDTALLRVWRAARMSWWLTMLLHRFPAIRHSTKDAAHQFDYLFALRSTRNVVCRAICRVAVLGQAALTP